MVRLPVGWTFSELLAIVPPELAMPVSMGMGIRLYCSVVKACSNVGTRNQSPTGSGLSGH